MKPPVLMVHGAFVGGWTFDDFRKPFEAAGHAVTALDLPGHGTRAREGVAGLSMADYGRAVVAACRGCETPPILIGHSMGGLVALLAAGRTPVARLVMLAPSPPWGVMGTSLEEAASAVSLYALGPFWLQAVAPDYGIARRYSFDRMPKEQRKATFERMGSESGLALWQTLNWWLDPCFSTRMRQVSAPVLAISGGQDVIHPPATVEQIARRAGGQHRSFPQMSHWLPGEPGWQEVARACLDWIAEPARPVA